jgi:hypothetical protein
MKGAQTWTPQKENKMEGRESFILKQTHFSVNNDMQHHGNILTYDLCSATVSKHEQFPEDNQVGTKHVTTDVILMAFQFKERL